LIREKVILPGILQDTVTFFSITISLKSHLPNILTCFNLFSGCIAVVMFFRGHIQTGAYFIFAAAFFDLLDGMAARQVESNSAYGKELDSLADMVSFGFIPGFIMFKLLQSADLINYFPNLKVRQVVQFLPFIVTIFSALRLAKFNLDTRQSKSFLGLPTPASTLFIISLPLILIQFPGKFDAIILNPWIILFTCGLMSFLLTSEIPLFSMKFSSLRFSENVFQYILVAIALILVPVLFYAAIPILIFLYILLSIIQNSLKTKNQ
jgi:CDP-diacylglycerol---serine O-phosphatidyltransferase